MTVAELIKRLGDFDPGKEAVFFDSEFGAIDIGTVDLSPGDGKVYLDS